MRVQAPAKINLSLEVAGVRADGFHDLVSIMQTVSLFDTLEIERAAGIVFTCSDPSLQSNNLVSRAATVLRDRCAPGSGASIHLEKLIPFAAGLGGGSSDAASALLALERLWRLDLTREQMMALAAEIGSDVPFFLHGGTCLVEGRGESVSPLPPPATSTYLLVNAGISVSTAEMFAALLETRWTDGAGSYRAASELLPGGSLQPGYNAFQETLFAMYPAVLSCFEAVSEIAPEPPFITGTGSTVVAPFAMPAEAQMAAKQLSEVGYWVAPVTAPVPKVERLSCSGDS